LAGLAVSSWTMTLSTPLLSATFVSYGPTRSLAAEERRPKQRKGSHEQRSVSCRSYKVFVVAGGAAAPFLLRTRRPEYMATILSPIRWENGCEK